MDLSILISWKSPFLVLGVSSGCFLIFFLCPAMKYGIWCLPCLCVRVSLLMWSQNHVRSITLSCVADFRNYLAQMLITTRQCIARKQICRQLESPGHKGHVNFVHIVTKARVRPIASFYIVGFQNHLAQMIIMTLWCGPCKNHVATLKVMVTPGTLLLCIG